MSKKIYLTWMLLLIATFACKQTSDETTTPSVQIDSLQTQANKHEIVIANPIVYDVVIQNLDKDDTWKEKSLENLDRKFLIDYYFKTVYDGDIAAYDFFSNKVMSRKELKDFEETVEFDRDKVGKIQFYEQWYLDTMTQQLRKQVTKMVFGYHKLTTDSQLVGYKPVFSISFQP